MNAPLSGYEVDALFPEHRLIVELDGWRYHRTRQSFERDRERDAHALASGFPTVRITKQRIDATPDREAARLRKILAARLDGGSVL
jgi:very-short-patch-repair endonuclease